MHDQEHNDRGENKTTSGLHEHGSAREEGERARRHLSDVTDRVRSEASRAGKVGRKRSADVLRSVSEAARDAGDGSSSPTDAIGRVLGDAADYVEHMDFKELGTEAVRVARRHPAAVMSGLAILGFAAGRVLSARPPADSDEGGDGGGADTQSIGSEGRLMGTISRDGGPRPASFAEPLVDGPPSPSRPGHRSHRIGTGPTQRS